MTDKRKALEPILTKVGKFFALLSSDNREEVATAAAMMNETLKKAGLDVHDYGNSPGLRGKRKSATSSPGCSPRMSTF
jgi:hypothetical protein